MGDNMEKRIVAFILCFPLIFSGCIEKKQETIENKGQELTISLENFPKTLESFKDKNEEEIGCALFDGLVSLKEDGNIEGTLAENYSISKDEITYTFKLRNNIYWSSGKEITSYDFVEFFKAMLDSKRAIDNVEELYCIFGAEAYNKGKGPFSNVAINSIDKNTLQIRMNTKNKDFIYNLTKPKYRLRKNFDLLKEYNEKFKDIEYSGPYRINALEKNKFLELGINEKYRDKPKVQQMRIVMNNREMAMAAFELGKIDFLFNVPINHREPLKDFTEYSYDGNLYSLVFNMDKGKIGENINFRRALKEVVKSLYAREDLYEEAGLIEPRENIAFLTKEEKEKLVMGNDLPEKIDISKINQWLKDIDFDKEKEISILIPEDNTMMFLGEKLKNVLKEELEMNIKTVYLKEDKYDENLKSGNFTLALKLFNNPKSLRDFFQCWTKDDKNNYARYGSIEYEKVFEKYKNTSSNDDKILLTQILKRDMPYIPLYYTSISYGISKKITNIELDGNNNINFKALEAPGK